MTSTLSTNSLFKTLVEIPPAAAWENYLTLVYRDDDFIVVDKTQGVYAHPNHSLHEVVSVSGLVKPWLNYTDPPATSHSIFCTEGSINKNNTDELSQLRQGLVHRLDRDTSGLMVIARHEKSETILKKFFKERLIIKKYQALIKGHLYQTITMEDYIIRDPLKRNKRKIVPLNSSSDSTTYNPRLALLTATPIQFFEDYTLVDIELLTGRTHQIRVQFSHRNLPVVGDSLYQRGRREDLYLCAYELSFPEVKEHSTEELEELKDLKKPTHQFKIELPDFFRQKLNNLK